MTDQTQSTEIVVYVLEYTDCIYESYHGVKSIHRTRESAQRAYDEFVEDRKRYYREVNEMMLAEDPNWDPFVKETDPTFPFSSMESLRIEEYTLDD